MEQKREQQFPGKETEIVRQQFLPQQIPAGEISEEDMQRRIKYAERYQETLDKIKKIAIRMTNRHDWVDQDGQPYLMLSGCTKIAAGFGVQVFGVRAESEQHKDDTGEYIEYTVDGYARWNNIEIHEIGVANTRDKFFARRKRDGETYYLPLSEVDRPSVKKKSHTNFYNRLIKNLLGLYFTWEDIESITNGQITKAGGGPSVKFDKGKLGGNTDSPDTKDRRALIRQMLLDITGGSITDAAEMLADMTKYEYNGKSVSGKKSVDGLSEKQIDYLFPKLKAEHDKYLKEMENRK